VLIDGLDELTLTIADFMMVVEFVVLVSEFIGLVGIAYCTVAVVLLLVAAGASHCLSWKRGLTTSPSL
jgi:hypothetical protein